MQLEAVHFGHDNGQLALQVLLGLLVIVIGEFADTVLELEVAQIFVDLSLAIVQMLRRGDAGVFKRYGQAKLNMMREAFDRRANEHRETSGTAKPI